MLRGAAGRIAILVAVIGSWTPSALAEQPTEFHRDVKPILAQRCFRCHSSLEQESSLRLDSVPAILKGGDSGTVIVPGNSKDSRLIHAVQRRGDLKMPPEGEPLNDKQIAVLQAWIDGGGLVSPAGSGAKSSHWSFQKPVRPPVPQVADPAWSANPIDAFIGAKHAELGLTPVAEAPTNLLLRRIHLDLVGLPPTVKDLEDRETYEAVVDQLLASPHYGERWGRHWMDVWRYSDWDGYKAEVRESKPHIWRWRDWIVESLNDDKPYDRMVQEMLAADELAPDDPDALRATGYLVRSWYKFNRNKWLDDCVEHTGKAFLGLTFNCCRCHDHMYDPLEQREYYALRAFFEPYDVRTDRLPGEPNTDKVGLVRVFDAQPDAQTFVFIRGNEKEPQKDEPLVPAFPELFADVPGSIQPIELPKLAAYPGLAAFIRDETLAAARQEVEKAEAELTTAAKKFEEALHSPLENTPVAQSQAPSPSIALVDADAQLGLATATLAAAEKNLAFTAARLVADDAAFATPPAEKAKELALAAAQIERKLKLLQANQSLLQSEIALTAAQRSKQDDDAKTTQAATTAQTAFNNALKARAEAVDALERPLNNYTYLTPVYPTASTGRRLALARWITSSDNPLAARVAINHIWLRHFGTPLVPTVFDFGMNGKPPTNQPLLDWLAVELMENGWRMKPIHRLIVTSRTYRLATTGGMGTEVQNPKSKIQNLTAIDPENLYYWRFSPRRVEAEIVRDATLWVAGSLDPTRGGPDLDPELALTNPRRSLYFRAAKEKKVQFLSLFDSANPVECYRRSESIAPQQALAMANSTLTLAQARVLAKRISDALAHPSADAPRRFVESAFVRILCREPTRDELSSCLEFLAAQATALSDSQSLTAFSAGPVAIVAPSTDPQQRARENLVHVLLNHNDFVTVR